METRPGNRFLTFALRDNTPGPPRTRLYLSRENAWDNTDITLPPDGKFEFKGVPAEGITERERAELPRLRKNPGKDWLNEGRLLGVLKSDLDGFIIHLEKGARFEQGEGPADADRYPREKPLPSAKLP